MKEKINIINEIEDNNNQGSFFAHLLLNNVKTDDLTEIAKSLNSPKSKIEVELIVNGKQVMVNDFNAVLKEWFDQINKSHAEKYERLATEEGLLEKAQEIVRKRLGKVDNYLESLKSFCAEQMEDWGNYEF